MICLPLDMFILRSKVIQLKGACAEPGSTQLVTATQNCTCVSGNTVQR